MNTLDSLQDDILSSAPLSNVLRKALVLAYRLKNQEFKEWIDRELNGYPIDAVLPEYRVLSTQCSGTFTNRFRVVSNVAFPVEVFPADIREDFRSLSMRQGIREIESMLDMCQKSKKGTLQSNFAGSTTAFLANRVYEDYACLSAWRSVSCAGLAGILDAIRNRLLMLKLALAEQYPEAAELDFAAPASNPSSEQVAQVFHYHVAGSGHTFQAGTNTQHRAEMLTMNEVTIGDSNTFEGDFVVAHSIEQS